MSPDPLLLRGLRSLRDLDGPHALLMADGRIAALDGDAEDRVGEARVLDADGLTAVPGFIELQVNGIDGHDFTSNPSAMWVVGSALARHGVTAFLPTIISSPRGGVEAALRVWQDGPPRPTGAIPLGVHLEGPFIARAGAHDPDLLRSPDLDELRGWLGTGAMRLLTMAPELPDALATIGLVVEAGAVAAIGHTVADAATTRRAVDAGARYATHLFNAMPPLAHRDPGAAGALLADERVTLGLIVDGRHLDALVVGLVARLAPERISLVSDAIATLDAPDGTHRLGSREVTVRDGVARLADGTHAGSVIGLDACVREMATITGSARLAVEAVTTVPALLLREPEGRGSLGVGCRADVTLLDADLNVRATIVGGSVAHAEEALAWL